MAHLLLPTPPEGYPDFTVQVPLTGVTYTLRYKWAERADAWFFSISDAAGPILLNQRIAVGNNLLAYTADPRKPDGVIMVVAPDRDESDPGLLDLGKRVQLVFVDAASVAAAALEES